MTLQILDNLWDLKVNQAFSNTQFSHSLGVFTSPYVVILVSSTFALPLWRQGGNIAQSIILPDNSLAYSGKKELILNQYSLLEFSILKGSNYELFYFPLARLETVQIKVWEYIGQTKDQAIENLVATLETSAILTVDFSELTPSLSSISTLVNSTNFQVLTRLSALSTLINSLGSQVLTRLSALSTLINSLGSQILTRLDAIYVSINNLSNKPQILIRVNQLLSNQPKEIRLWEQNSIVAAIKIESIYIDSPGDDKIKIEVLTSTNIKLTERTFDKDQTPYDFPDLVISKTLKVRFSLIGGNPIDRVFIYCSPVPEPSLIDL